jgi:UDP-N-acetylglucosamine/UDP-N-acetylgalactosamine diphosphorylase
VRSFQENDYFGLNPADVILFPQGTMVCFDTKGKILLSEKGCLSTSPDGHGGSLRALYAGGALADMEKRGVEQISYFQVDNPLVYVVDPLFIGLHVLDGAEMSSKAVIKTSPLEKVGNFVLVDGKVTVIEYSDLPEELAHKKNKDGKLMIEYGSIAIHVISRDFVKRINEHGFSLPWHRAVKKVPFINEQGLRVEPAQPNAVKLETFVFDALPLAKKSIILEIDRKEQFAPIKNATGVDSLESSRQLQLERAAKWLTLAGVEVPCHPDGTIDVQVEISPLFALDADELTQKRDQIPQLTAGRKFYIE